MRWSTTTHYCAVMKSLRAGSPVPSASGSSDEPARPAGGASPANPSTYSAHPPARVRIPSFPSNITRKYPLPLLVLQGNALFPF